MTNQHHADVLVRVHINREPFETPELTSGRALYDLGGVSHQLYLFREEVGDKEDEFVEPNDRPIHLEQDAHFYSQAEFNVEVLYNGVKKPFEVRPHETVKRLLDESIRVFGATNPHTLSLYKEGTELPDAATLKEAGVKPNDRLLLRPGAVKGG